MNFQFPLFLPGQKHVLKSNRRFKAIATSLLAQLALISAGVTSFSPTVFAQSGTKVAAVSTNTNKDSSENKFKAEGSGALLAMTGKKEVVGLCPLKYTSVATKISGYVARVNVTQTFENPFKDKIEAIYTFPLSESGAVDEMLMKVGKRVIHGTIKKREEAKQIYEQAKAHGHVASLLDQERPNIFTQSVANIMPGEKVEITLKYVELLPFEAGQFTFAFPTVVGPRFIPGPPVGKTGTGWAPDTTSVPDASRITPNVTPEGTRAGHDISITVDLDAAIPISSIESKLHDVDVERPSSSKAMIALKDKNTIPNRDFVLNWTVRADELTSGYLTYRSAIDKDDSGYFTLMILPPKRVTTKNVSPKEMIFLIDQSGSQSGKPLEKAKETMCYILDHMNPQDTFQVIAFSNDASLLFDKPGPASPEMKAKAHAFISKLDGNGGTWMAPAVENACSIPADAHRLRIVTFMTDGYVGNDFAILGMIRKLRGKSRWFSFGTGNSVNRMLIDGIAREGGGEADYVLLNGSGEEVGKKFYKKIAEPVLTDVKIDFGNLAVKDVYPSEMSDVWSERPLYFKGRYLKPGEGTITLTGFAAGKPYKQTLHVTFPERNPANEVLGSIWARAKVDRLMAEDWFGAQGGSVNKELKEEIIKVALDHHIMTQYTSFVAVEEKSVTKGGPPTTIPVPVEMPQGVSRKGVFGEQQMLNRLLRQAQASNELYGDEGMEMDSAPRSRFGYGIAGRYSANNYKSKAGTGAHLSPLPPTFLGINAAPSPTKSGLLKDSRDYVAHQAASNPKAQPLSPGASGKKHLAKLDHLLQQLVTEKGAGAIDGVTVRDGKVKIKVELINTSFETIKALKEAGMEILVQSNAGPSYVIGRIEINKLEQLTKLKSVQIIKPAL